jgi:hypothetical protein
MGVILSFANDHSVWVSCDRFVLCQCLTLLVFHAGVLPFYFVLSIRIEVLDNLDAHEKARRDAVDQILSMVQGNEEGNSVRLSELQALSVQSQVTNSDRAIGCKKQLFSRIAIDGAD